MIVYLAAALIALFYLSRVPVNFSGRAILHGAPTIRFGLGFFGRVRTVVWRPAPRRGKAGSPSAPRGLPVRKLLSLARRYAQTIQVKQLDVSVGGGDACATSLLYGTVCGLLCALRLPARVRPVFAGDARADCRYIVTARLGHSIGTAAHMAAILGMWRLSIWKDDRLKELCERRWSPFATWWTSIRSSATRWLRATARP